MSAVSRASLVLLLFSVLNVQVSGFTTGNGKVASLPSLSVSRGSFVYNPLISHRKTSISMTRGKSAMSLTMVIDRLSNECIEGVKQSHDIGNEIGLKKLNSEILFAGLVSRPERAERTLNKFGFTFDEVKASAVRSVQYKPGVNLEGPNPEKDALPFDDDAKSILNKACSIADRMESSTVRSEHVILALMGYNDGNKIETVPVIDVLQDMRSIRRAEVGFSVTKFCDDLVNALPLTPVSGDDVVVRDTVVIGGQSGPTNTLSEVGVDLTQLALEGKLDMVYGRDKEIRSALRTLGRRRKNNPCLIGDPGVGLVYLLVCRLVVFRSGLIYLF